MVVAARRVATLVNAERDNTGAAVGFGVEWGGGGLDCMNGCV